MGMLPLILLKSRFSNTLLVQDYMLDQSEYGDIMWYICHKIFKEQLKKENKCDKKIDFKFNELCMGEGHIDVTLSHEK